MSERQLLRERLSPEQLEQHKDAISRRAFEVMKQGYGCSEGLVYAMTEYLYGEADEDLVRVGTAFRGGIGGTEVEICGGLSGGVIILGLLYGRSRLDIGDDGSYGKAVAKRYHQKFMERFGMVHCDDLKADSYGHGPGKERCAVLIERTIPVLFEVIIEEECKKERV